jgi:protein involved in polysaccharide export with SLBB domain
VFVRKAPEYELPQSVVLAGEVAFPGIYALTAADVRLSDLLKRAGGLKAEAHAGGAQLVRGGHLVATNLDEALRAPGSTQDIELLSGDSIFVPRLDATVLVRGAVGFETRVRFEAGRNLDFYVERAGGYADNADRGRVTVTEQNGERKIVRLRRLVFDSKPEPGPGSTIFVPGRPASSSGGINWDSVLTKIVGIASATATVLIAVDRAK